MSAVPESSEIDVHRWTRELVGARGLFRILNEPKLRGRLSRLVDSINAGKIGREEVRTAFARAMYQQQGGIEELFDEFERLPLKTKTIQRRPPLEFVASRTGSAVAVAVEKVENQIQTLKLEIEAARRHGRELENLTRALVERSVMDATRIRGLEVALVTLADRTGLGDEITAIYSAATADFLHRKVTK